MFIYAMFKSLIFLCLENLKHLREEIIEFPFSFHTLGYPYASGIKVRYYFRCRGISGQEGF